MIITNYILRNSVRYFDLPGIILINFEECAKSRRFRIGRMRSSSGMSWPSGILASARSNAAPSKCADVLLINLG